MSRLTTVLLLLLLSSVGTAAALTPEPARSQETVTQEPAASPLPAPMPLTEGWEYRPDPTDAGRNLGWHNGTDTEGWRSVQVPHVFTTRTTDRDYQGTVGWYRVRFRGPDEGAWVVKFGSVRRYGDVWLNGQPLGYVDDPYVPVQIPATHAIRRGEDNVLVVRVDNRRDRWLREGWWNWGGLVRPVSLAPVPSVGLYETALLPEVRCGPGGAPPCTAKLRLDALLFNYRDRKVRTVVKVDLTSPSGRAITAQRAFSIAPNGTERRIRLGFRVPEPELWDEETPQFYRARVRVTDDEGLKQEEHLRVGVRQVTVAGGRLLLNGRPLVLRGAAIQEDIPGRGPALTDVDIEQIVADLKALNANVTRAHYLLNPRLLDRLDEEGILVWSQAAVYHADRQLRDPQGRSRALRTVYRTLLEARKHPSVITHSVANELAPEPDRHKRTADFLVKAERMSERLDPSVPISVDLLTYPNIPHQKAYDVFDLFGLNSYYGWYEGKPGIRSTADIGDLEPYLRSMRRKYPKQAMAITEFGAEATFKGPKTVKETFAFQTDYIRKTLNIVNRQDWLAGAIYWTVREFYVKPDWDGGANRRVRRDALHNKGLLTYHGKPKEAWHTVRHRFGIEAR